MGGGGVVLGIKYMKNERGCVNLKNLIGASMVKCQTMRVRQSN